MAPYLARLGEPSVLTGAHVEQLKSDCLKDLRTQLVDLANIIQSRFETVRNKMSCIWVDVELLCVLQLHTLQLPCIIICKLDTQCTYNVLQTCSLYNILCSTFMSLPPSLPPSFFLFPSIS